MKSRSITKIIILALSLVLLTAVISLTVSAEGEGGGDIYSTTIVHDDKISIAIAVKATAAEIADGTVVVNYTWDGSDVVHTAAYREAHAGKEGYVWVVTEGVAAYDLGLNANITSYVKSGNEYVEVESGVYSVATFLYNKLYKEGVTGEAKACYEALLAYGATSQAYLNKNADAPVNALNYAYTKTEGVKINGKTSVFANEVTVTYNGDLIVESWVVNGVEYPATQTTFEIDGVVEIGVVCADHRKVNVNIGEFANGTVTADKDSYEVGDTVTLTVAPNKNFAQKLYINGEPLLVDTNSKYSFVIEEGKTYDITGEFVSTQGKWYWTAEYIVLNQAHGVFHSPATTEKNGELVPAADKCYGGKVLVKDPSGGTKKDFAIVLKMTFSDGQKVEIRLVNKDGQGHYMVQSMSGMFGSWKWYYDLNDAENAAVANGEGVWFELVRDGSNIDILVNGKVLAKRADTPISLAESTVLNQFKITTYNFSYAIDVKYEFYMIK